MNTRLDNQEDHSNEARSAVEKARQALRKGDRTAARQLAEQAAALAPQMEDPWLVLAAIASPRASVEYIQKALKINPNSPRARRGMEWAMQRQRETSEDRSPASGSGRTAVKSSKAPKSAAGPGKRRSPLLPILLLGLGCIVCGAAAWSASTSPVLASILNRPPARATAATPPPSWAQASIPKPTYTPGMPPTEMAAAQPTLALSDVERATATPAATEQPVNSPTTEPTQLVDALPTATETSIPTAEPTWTGSLSMEIVADTPTSQAPTPAPVATRAPSSPGNVASGQRWIDVNLSQQMVYAYEGDKVVNSFLASTGTWLHPTVTGQYHIYVKLRYTDMSGPDYYLPNVPYTMYFYEGYGLHGTYWHHNFGTPMSHGCVNLSTPDAEWLYNWASVGTLVNVHY